MRRPAVFLDRDGTIIEQVHYIRDPAQVRLIPRAAEALHLLRSAGFACVVVSNQSAVGRGLATVADVEAVTQEMNRHLALAGAAIDGWYFCPSAPARPGDPDAEEAGTPERKPAPGMLLRAAAEMSLDLARSWMVGDTLSDLLAGRRARVRGTALVRTGYGGGLEHPVDAADHVAEDLLDAARWIVSQASESGPEAGDGGKGR